MSQTIEKVRVERISEADGMAFIRKGIDALESATRDELAASVVGLAETMIEKLTDADDHTRAALVMEVVFNTISENRITLPDLSQFDGQVMN